MGVPSLTAASNNDNDNLHVLAEVARSAGPEAESLHLKVH